MKHYANTKWNELGVIEYWGRDALKDEFVSSSKRIYRRRERAALKRQTAELVEMAATESLAEARYWERKAAEHAAEYERMGLAVAETRDEVLAAGMAAENRLYSAACRRMDR